MRDLNKRLTVLERRKVEEAGQPQLSLAQWIEWSDSNNWEEIYKHSPVARKNMESARRVLADFEDDEELVGQNE